VTGADTSPRTDPGATGRSAAAVGPAGVVALRDRTYRVPRRGAVALPAVVAGLGLALSLPPWGWWIVAFPAAGLLFWRLGGLRPRTRLWAGFLAGLGLYVPGLQWVRSFSPPGAVVLIAVEALFPALACLAVPSRGIGARALVFPAAMTLAEAVRMTWPFGGLPLGGVFLGQADGPVLAVARLGGPLLLTAAVYTGGVALAALVDAAGRAVRRTGGSVGDDVDVPAGVPWAVATRRLGVAGAVALVATVATVAVGVRAPDGGPSHGAVAVAAVQGGGVRGFRKAQVDPATVEAAQYAATSALEQLPPAERPRLVVWPEDVVSLPYPLDGSPEEASLSALAQTLDATLVVGVTETVSPTAFRNEVVAWGPDGTLEARYEKVHRVPFGEYVPYRSFFRHLANLSAVPLDAVPGTGTGLMETSAGPLGVMVSYEVAYADRGRSAVRAGAQLLLVPTNTSSYATAQVPTQEVAAAEVQAVQQGRDLVQAAPTGYTAVVTNRGRLLARSVLGARQVVRATVDRRTGVTVYVRFGDTPVLVAAALAVVAGWYLARTAGRRRRTAGGTGIGGGGAVR